MRNGDSVGVVMEYLRQKYNEQLAEARTCGYEFPDFEEWLDPSLTRRRAMERIRLDDDSGHYDYDENDF